MATSIERRLAAAEATLAARSDEGLNADERAIRVGDLTNFLHDGQKEAREAFERAPGSRFVFEVARRWGKTWLLLVLAFSVCIRQRKARVVYGAPTLKLLAEFVLPTFGALAERFPSHLRPKWNAQKSHIEFPNGSYIHLFGADDKHKADRGRGPSAALAIFDEAGFCPLLRYVLRSVFRPSLLHSGGRTIVASTPAELPDHDFTAIAEKAEANGAYFNRDVWSNPLLTKEQIEKFIADDAHDEGISVEAYVDSDDFRREYLAERVINRTLLAVPEWAQWRESRFVRVPRPPLFRGHTTIDFGGNDPHAALFGYWHAELGLVVERELLLKNDEPSRLLSDEVKRVEGEVWGVDRWDGSLQSLTAANIRATWGEKLPLWLMPEVDRNAPPQPYHRISDTNMELARHLHSVGLSVVPLVKSEKQLMVNHFRNLVRDGKFWLSPDCVDTDRHLRQTTWRNEKRKEWARRGGEHGDLLDCFEAGTKIATPQGLRAIEDLRVGDLVDTRAGPRPLLFAGPTRVAEVWELRLSTGAALHATPGHRFLTLDGWVPLSGLVDGCTLIEWNQSWCGGVADDGGAIRRPGFETIASTMWSRSGSERPTCIAPSGSPSMAPFRPGWSSIMSMEIHSTTPQRISRALPPPNTWQNMARNPEIDLGRCAISVKRGQRHGIELMLGANGLPAIQGASGSADRFLSMIASSVEQSTSRRPSSRSRADERVWLGSVENLDSTTRRESARGAGEVLLSIGTRERNAAVVRVVGVRPLGRAALVYDLQVADQPEFFANGVLAHNCAIYKTLNVSREVPLPPATKAPPPLLPQTGRRDRLQARLARAH